MTFCFEVKLSCFFYLDLLRPDIFLKEPEFSHGDR